MDLINSSIDQSLSYGLKAFNPKTMPLRGNIVQPMQQAHLDGRLSAFNDILRWAEGAGNLESIDDIKAVLHIELMNLNNSKVAVFNEGEMINGVEHWTSNYIGDAATFLQ